MDRLENIIGDIRREPETAFPYLMITNKAKQNVVFDPTLPQLELLRIFLKLKRIIILKARQMGFSTLIQALYFLHTILIPNTNTVIVSHDSESTKRMLVRMKLFYDKLHLTLPNALIPPLDVADKRRNEKEMYFPSLNSRIFVGTAGADAFGRGDVIHNLHLSEVSSYKGSNANELVKGLIAAVPLDGGNIFLESTARGEGDLFHALWTDEESNYHKFFMPWFKHDEYRLTEAELQILTVYEVDYPTVDNLSEDEIDFIQKAKNLFGFSIELDQIAFRRYAKREYKELYLQEFPEDDVTCWLSTKSDVFDTEVITKLINQCKDPIITTNSGGVEIWEEPVEGVQYVLAADPSEGDIESDYCAATLLRTDTNQHVASMHGRWRDYRFASLLAQLGEYYNNAMIAVERNNHGHSVLNSLRHTEKYRYIYQAEDEKMGFLTTKGSKTIILTSSVGFVKAIETGDFKTWDVNLLKECLAFETKKDGSLGAKKGKHDDKLMSAAIVWSVRGKRKTLYDESGNKKMVL